MRPAMVFLVAVAVVGCSAEPPPSLETEWVELEIGVAHTLVVEGAGSSVWAAGDAAAEVSCARERVGQNPVALVGHYTRSPRELPVSRDGLEWHRVGVIDRLGDVTIRCKGPEGTPLQAQLVVSTDPGQ